jgi:hypothetical protein
MGFHSTVGSRDCGYFLLAGSCVHYYVTSRPTNKITQQTRGMKNFYVSKLEVADSHTLSMLQTYPY